MMDEFYKRHNCYITSINRSIDYFGITCDVNLRFHDELLIDRLLELARNMDSLYLSKREFIKL
jgi:hypothetical protein